MRAVRSADKRGVLLLTERLHTVTSVGEVRQFRGSEGAHRAGWRERGRVGKERSYPSTHGHPLRTLQRGAITAATWSLSTLRSTGTITFQQ